LHVISLAKYAMAHPHSWAVDSLNGRLRLKADNDRLLQELALEREASRIKDARMARIPALRRPQNLPTVGRILQEKPAAPPQKDAQTDSGRVVTSQDPNHVWLIDLTTVPIGNGFCCS
jgi:hypothetical protein